MEATSAAAKRHPSPRQGLRYAATLKFQATPLRAERLALAYLPVVPRARDYGCRGYSFYRSEDDTTVFTHVSYWDDKGDFEQYWFSHEMQAVRRELIGVFDLPVTPHWHVVLEHGG